MKTFRAYRFEIYLFTSCLILFGSLVFPGQIYEQYISPLIVNLNIAAGFVLISMRKKAFWYYAVIFAIGMLLFLGRMVFQENMGQRLELVRLGFYSVFYTIVTVEIILQVWGVKQVNHNVIYGLVCGYISLGLVAFFLVLGIEVAHPGSFSGLPGNADKGTMIDALLYYAFITLMTIGYGDMAPLTPIAQKAAMLIGLTGQFYLVILTAVVVEKYMGDRKDSSAPPGNPEL
jgi:hypothetical protein